MSYAMAETLGAFTPDNLIAGTFPIQTATVSIAANQTLSRGALLSKNDDGECVLVSATTETVVGENESEEEVTTVSSVYAVLADDITTGDEAANAEVYLSGVFNVNALTAADGVVIEDLTDEARKLCLYFVKNIKQEGDA